MFDKKKKIIEIKIQQEFFIDAQVKMFLRKYI